MSFVFRLAEAVFCLVPAAACVMAWRKSLDRPLRYGDVPAGFWLGPFAFLLVLAGMRLFNIPELVRKSIKHYGQGAGIYAERRGLQSEVLVVLAFVGIAVLVIAVLRAQPRLQARRSARLAAFALAGVAGETALLAARLISLHQLDEMLFGPAKLGWVLDAGCLALIAYAAIRFAQLPPPQIREHPEGVPPETGRDYRSRSRARR